ncbi:ABC transporter ATP-binding protein [Patescibacteria group bacterium]|nr:ABC transporter ATP-binding protein [Patescibacteria group bacterium]
MNAIEVKNLSKEFILDHFKHKTLKERIISSFHGRKEVFKALDNVSFSVGKGEFFGIIGNNGSGKSTLLKILANIYPTTKGEVKINGKLSPFLELGVGFVMELSAWENIFLYGSLLGMSEKQIKERIDDIIAFSELEKFIDTKLNKFSSGMLVRLAFSTAIQADFDILLLDEVLAVGDYNFQMKCQDVFSSLKQKGKSVVFVSHDLAAIMHYCDRTMLLEKGKKIACGNPREINKKYLEMNLSDAAKTSAQPSASRYIKKLELLSKIGKPQKIFKTGEEIGLKVNFDHDAGETNFSVDVFNQDNLWISGINTKIDQAQVNKYINQRYFEVKYSGLKLATGKYRINVGIWDKESRKLDESHIDFRFISNSNDYGVYNLDHKWI